MTELGEINDRQVLYIKHDLATVWFKDLPKSNWLLFTISDRDLPEIFNEVARRSIDNNVVYVCSSGPESESFNSAMDDAIMIRDVENVYLPKYCILTTSSTDIGNEYWHAIFSAMGETETISKIICLDLTSGEHTDKLKGLIEKMKTGWMPEDNE
jgi:hypothetical protein